jgi:hypothetical protein
MEAWLRLFGLEATHYWVTVIFVSFHHVFNSFLSTSLYVDCTQLSHCLTKVLSQFILMFFPPSVLQLS